MSSDVRKGLEQCHGMVNKTKNLVRSGSYANSWERQAARSTPSFEQRQNGPLFRSNVRTYIMIHRRHKKTFFKALKPAAFST